jgi:hypothetical protein
MYSFSHTDPLLDGEPKRLIKCGDGFVPVHDLQIHFHAPSGCQSTLRKTYQLRAHAAALMQ